MIVVTPIIQKGEFYEDCHEGSRPRLYRTFVVLGITVACQEYQKCQAELNGDVETQCGEV